MKRHQRRLCIMAILLLAFLCSSCSVWRAERRYKIARLNKSTELVKATQPAGYYFEKFNGVVANTDWYRPVKIVITNKETGAQKSYFLLPGQWLPGYLIDGNYKAVAYYQNHEVGRWEFPVNLDTHNYMGNEMKWYLVYEVRN